MLVGPTSAAMVVSSSKGAILPTTMASLFTDNGYRTANNGTAWSAFSFVADYFNFNEFYSTSNFESMTEYLSQDKNKDGMADYFVVVACGNGLFTTSGHYITLIADNEGTITVYDPYIYNGKFTTASRKKANVSVDGNIAYVSEKNFKTYANAKNYWIFSNDCGSGTNISLYKDGDKVNVKIPIAIAWQGGSESLVDDGNQQFWISNDLLTNGYIQATGTICFDGGTNDLIEIDHIQIWCSELYMSNSNAIKIKNTTGNKYSFKKSTKIYQNKCMSGNFYNYKANTSIIVLDNVSDKIDYIQVVKTGRRGYVLNDSYK